MGQRPAGQVGEYLLDHGVVAVLLLGLQQGEGAIGEHGVVAPGREQLFLPGGLGSGLRSRTRRTISRAVICCFFFSDVNAVYRVSATSVSETHRPCCSSQTALG